MGHHKMFRVLVVLGGFAEAASKTRTAWLFSDSLGWQAKDAFEAAVVRAGLQFSYVGFPGTAICDFFNNTQAVAEGDVVAVQFSGNNFTPCMVDPATGAGFVGNGLLDKYAKDALDATALLLARGAIVVWQGAPISAFATVAHPNGRQITAQYMVLPHAFAAAAAAGTNPAAVFFNDAGLSVVNASDPVFTPVLPCLPEEVAGGQCAKAGDVIQVRAPDGGHFCPQPNSTFPFDCEVYCSGCVRYGTSMAQSTIAAVVAAAAVAAPSHHGGARPTGSVWRSRDFND
jgi:hypothetical protein